MKIIFGWWDCACCGQILYNDLDLDPRRHRFECADCSMEMEYHHNFAREVV